MKTIKLFDVFSLGHSTAFLKYYLTSLNILKTEANKTEANKVLEEIFVAEWWLKQIAFKKKKKRNCLLHFSFLNFDLGLTFLD